MNGDSIFVEEKLLEPLKKSELYECIKQAKNGSESHREKVINHNIRLVINQVFKRFLNTSYEKKELVCVGMVGLIKAVDTFDINKNFDFSTYAIKCIDNEILMFIRKRKKYLKEESLNKVVNTDMSGNEVMLQDIISDNTTDFVDDVLQSELLSELITQIEMLNALDKEIIKMYFGFYNNRQYSQSEIGVIFRLSQSTVSRIISRVVDTIGERLKVMELIEKTDKKRRMLPKNKNILNAVGKIDLIYEYFENFIKEYLDQITIEKVQYSSDNLSKTDCLKILSLVRGTIFASFLDNLSPKEIIVVAWQLGYLEGKSISIKSLAKFLKVDEENIMKIIKKGLLYKKQYCANNGNDFNKITEEPKKLLLNHYSKKR